jgi:hypothetical protein
MRGSGGMAPVIPNFNTCRGEWSVLRCGHFTLGIQLNARLRVSQAGLGRFEVVQNLFPQPRIYPQFIGCPGRSLVTTPLASSRLRDYDSLTQLLAVRRDGTA